MDRRLFLFAAPALAVGGRAEAKPAAGTSDAAAAAALVSRIRAGYGLGAVAVDGRMNEAALHQARAVAALGRLSHGDFAGRVRRFGLRGSAMAENLAYGSSDVGGAVAQWQRSAPHMQNLLLASATRMGIGRSDKGRVRYWAMVIG